MYKSPKQEQDRLFAQASALTWLLDKAGLGEDVSTFSSFSGIQLCADEIAQHAAKWNPTNAQLMSILQTLAGSDSEFKSTNTSREYPFYCALRLTLAIERLSVAAGITEKISKELNALRVDVQRHYDFDSASFAEHLHALRQKL